MDIRAIVHNGQVRLPGVPDGTEVRVIVDDEALACAAAPAPFEREPLDEAEVMADVRWATGRRFA